MLGPRRAARAVFWTVAVVVSTPSTPSGPPSRPRNLHSHFTSGRAFIGATNERPAPWKRAWVLHRAPALARFSASPAHVHDINCGVATSSLYHTACLLLV